jgi:methyl-accepting chemotaxis protein
MVELLWLPARLLLGRAPVGLRRGVLMAMLLACVGVCLVAPHAGPFTAAALCVFGYFWIFHTIEQTRAVSSLKRAVKAVTDSDLSQSGAVDASGALGDIAGQVELMKQTLSRLVANIRSEAQLVAMAGERLAHSARELSSSTDEQAASLKQTSSGVSALAASVKRNADDAGQADRLAGEVHRHAEEGIAAVGKAVDSVRRIEERSHKMSQIIGVIDSITFQTNILALNAAVEAARAGDSGRGFAVVAQEVRVLAQRTAQAAAEVKTLIQGSAQEVDAGVHEIQSTSRLLQAMVDSVRQVAERMRQVASTNAEQSQSLGELAQAVVNIDHLTQRNAQLVAGSVTAADALRRQADTLKAGVASMRLRQGCADEARALAERAAQCVRQLGVAQAARRFHERTGGFIDRDLFVIMMDRGGNFVAFGADPSKANRPAVAAPGVDVAELNRMTYATADAGGGWVEFRSFHPLTRVPVDKMAYVMPVDKHVVMVSVNRSDGGPAQLARHGHAMPGVVAEQLERGAAAAQGVA